MKGNKPSNTFRASSFTRVAKEISKKFGVDCQPKHVDNHLRTVKTTWSTIVKIRAKSGFGWDENLKMVTCAKETYVQEVQAFPDHEPFLNKKIEMYDEMAIVVGKDIAIGGFGRSHIEVDMEGEDKSSEKQTCSNSTSKSRSNRKRDRANSELESEYTMIAEKMDNIAKSIAKMDAFSYVDDLYDAVMKIEGFDELMLSSAFDYLMANQIVARAFVKKSVNLRRHWLESFFNQGSGH